MGNIDVKNEAKKRCRKAKLKSRKGKIYFKRERKGRKKKLD